MSKSPNPKAIGVVTHQARLVIGILLLRESFLRLLLVYLFEELGLILGFCLLANQHIRLDDSRLDLRSKPITHTANRSFNVLRLLHELVALLNHGSIRHVSM